ncbi:ABC transporter substrate-binding protein [Candidatus Daviesbacteria bacterium]|nr:ABC transporter substrate-binding protein [Candidatus Daviesbacteria bacterium]
MAETEPVDKNNRVSRRQFLITSAGTVGLSLLTGCGIPLPTVAPATRMREDLSQEIKFFAAQRPTTYLQAIVAGEKGIFRDHGITVDRIIQTNPLQNMATDHMALRATVGVAGLIPYMHASAAGADLVWFGSEFNNAPFVFLTRLDPNQTTEKLKVGIQSTGHDTHLITEMILPLIGIPRDRVIWEPGGTPQTRLEFLGDGRLDAAVSDTGSWRVFEPRLRPRGVKPVFDTYDPNNPFTKQAHFPIALFASRAYLKDNSDKMRRLLIALGEAGDQIVKDPQGAADALVKSGSVNPARAAIEIKLFSDGYSNPLQVTPNRQIVEAFLSVINTNNEEEGNERLKLDIDHFVYADIASKVK